MTVTPERKGADSPTPEKNAGAVDTQEHASTNDADEKGKVEPVPASITANAMLKVDDERADVLRRELETSRQGGWSPTTDEEKKMNSRLNLKIDMMVC